MGQSNLLEFLDDKKQKASTTLINSGLYSDSDEVDMIPAMYPLEDAPGLQSGVDQNAVKIDDAELNHNIHTGDSDGTVVLPKNKTSGVSEQVKGFLAGNLCYIAVNTSEVYGIHSSESGLLSNSVVTILFS